MKHEERGVSADRVKECFSIDEDTGLMVWRWRDGVPKYINVRHAGKLAARGTHVHGYLRVKIDGVRFGAHRVAFCLYHGRWPDGAIDHINGIKDDNRKCNLRDASPLENMRNRGKQENNTSGITGVSFHNASGKIRACVQVRGKQRHLGLFETVEQAVDARDRFYREHGFTNRHGA